MFLNLSTFSSVHFGMIWGPLLYLLTLRCLLREIDSLRRSFRLNCEFKSQCSELLQKLCPCSEMLHDFGSFFCNIWGTLLYIVQKNVKKQKISHDHRPQIDLYLSAQAHITSLKSVRCKLQGCSSNPEDFFVNFHHPNYPDTPI